MSASDEFEEDDWAEEDEEYEYEEEWEEEEEEESPPPRRKPKPRSKVQPEPERPGLSFRASLSVGFLAMLPLLIAYEVADSQHRSAAEMMLLRGFALLGDYEGPMRWLTIAVCAAAAFVVAIRASRMLLPSLGRIAVEGAVGALVLGPALVGLHGLLGVAAPSIKNPSTVPSGDRAAFVFGAAAWEELLFRVAAYSALYLIGRRVAGWVGAQDRLATGIGETLGVFGSAVLFAGAHLASWTSWLGPGGEPYDASVFTWRLLAGILLALVFRWRGPGVAAWTHGLFNVSILLGVGPDVFL